MTDDAKKTKLKYNNGTVSVDKDECVRAGNKILNDALSGAKKPREWWIRKTSANAQFAYDAPFETDNLVHVIEHSAYQNLEQELKEMHFAYAKAKTELYEAKAEIVKFKQGPRS